MSACLKIIVEFINLEWFSLSKPSNTSLLIKVIGVKAMKKEHRTALVEFVNKISDDELKFIGVRLVERLAGDLAIILEHFQTRPEVDAVLAAAGSGEEVFAILGVIQELVGRESKRRGIVISMRPLVPAGGD
jgi:hypothetical protein